MTDLPNATASVQQRVVRVFVSSTFKDMQQEREVLVKKTFPELRRRCRERQVEFVEVDLRWGITQEQSQRGETLPICLAEIHRCRPYFVGVLGERYGWVPKRINSELIGAQPWLTEHLEKSVTELEILHGVLNDPAMATRSYFYFRDPAYIEGIPADQNKADLLSEDPVAQEKLEALKHRIRRSGLPVRENYPDPETAGQLILDDLWTAIDKAFPADEVPDPLDQEAAEHEAFAASRAKIYIGREEYFKRLDEHVDGDGPPLVLVGESGVGKSALVANWARRYRQEHPGDFMILHFIGSSSQSADYVGIMRRIIAEIKRRYDLPDEIPSSSEKLREALPFWLASAAYSAPPKGRLILVLDGLNQLEDRDDAPNLGWLPNYFSPNIRVILSSLPGPSLDALRKRNWPEFQVHKLEPSERRRLIEEYLGGYRKTLSAPQLEQISTAGQTANPLYLRALLEELRVFGVYKELDAKINEYLAAATIPDLYGMILDRLEKDYEKDRNGLVRDAMSLVWATRRGLFESELLELLGDSNGPLPRAIWSPLYLAMEESLVNRSGLLTFFHDYLRQAVEHRFVRGKATQKAWRLRLADYFSERETGDRKADEFPWQLERAEEWEGLKDCVTDLAMFDRLAVEAKKYELMGYWLKIQARFDMVQAYSSSIAAYEAAGLTGAELAASMHNVAIFLKIGARFDGAEPMFRRALEIYEKVLGPNDSDTVACLNGLAIMLQDKRDYELAEPLYRRALEIREKLLGPNHPDTAGSLNNLGTLLSDKGDYRMAEPLYRRALEIYEKVLGPDDPRTAMSLNNLALLLHVKGDYEGAEALYRRALQTREKVLGPNHPDTAGSLNNLALLLQDKGNYEGAKSLYRRALDIRERVLGLNHPDTAASLTNMVALLSARRDYKGAEPLFRRAVEISEKVLGPDHPATADNLNALALLLQDKQDYGGAERLFRRAVEISEKVLGPGDQATVDIAENMAQALNARHAFLKSFTCAAILCAILILVYFILVHFGVAQQDPGQRKDSIISVVSAFLLSAFATAIWCTVSRKRWSWVRIALTVLGFIGIFAIDPIIGGFSGSAWFSVLATAVWCENSRKRWSWVRIVLTVVGFIAALTINSTVASFSRSVLFSILITVVWMGFSRKPWSRVRLVLTVVGFIVVWTHFEGFW